jgi:hypothetical protein
MEINWFEGGRRITKLAQGLVVAGCVAFASFSAPNDTITFETSWPNEPFRISDGDCYGSDDRSETRYGVTAGGKSIDAQLCFKGSPSEDGRSAIPYAAASKSGYFLMGKPYSDEVDQYIKKRSAEFRLSPQQGATALSLANAKWWKQKRTELRDATTFALVGCTVLWLLALTIGWIVRGFAGIKSGSDFKEIEHL